MSIKKALKSFWNWLKAELVAEVSGDIDIDGDGPEMPPPDGDTFADLQWVFGGFDGSQASPVDGVEIALDSVTPSGLRYHFKEGNLLALSALNSHDNPDCLACLFCLLDGVWRGGKFDWISSDRLSRDFANIKSGYHGWPADAVYTADAYAFCIVSKDGRRRTNVTVLEGNR